eukprot:CAMPEP_0194246114 /NCGR_PEP_ID=MMETSP0158-20130606/14471_1 /TAXON_ID=33649 /ORGANISM="Thalassionema nitzschioides, Strain L26-B" /LENGTH=753 /DNA_ID=CAMNT_0038981941 /DNA_START=38 /DNA_END=2299 /DNA_ORIENTATION=-
MTNFRCLALSILLGFSSVENVDSFTGISPIRNNGFSTLRMSTLPTTASEIVWTPSIKSGARDEILGPISKYCEDLKTVTRRKTRTVECGPIKFGSEHPIVRQTMATANTADVDATVDQIIRCADKGFDLVRITVQGRREANACLSIRENLFKKGYDIPLCADMHFQPKVALMVAEAVEKIRINPGNFADGTKDFDEHIYETEEEYAQERGYLVEGMIPLVEKCKELNRAMRIGTNHGSLSSRVLSFYGDTPRGMVESAIEFADICRSQDYHNFVFSMKASNPLVMVQAYRLLAAEQYRLGWDYPLHLGVTEAGEGEDGRMKSAIGIGTLLADGVGDTVRVSLTEDPEFEYEPCNRLAEIAESRLAAKNPEAAARQAATKPYDDTRDITTFARRQGTLPEQKEGENVDVRGYLHRDGSVLSAVTPEMLTKENIQYLYQELGCKTAVGMPFKDLATSDSILLRTPPPSSDTESRTAIRRLIEVSMGVIVPAEELEKDPIPNAVALMSLSDAIQKKGKLPNGAIRLAVSLDGTEEEETVLAIKELNPVTILLKPDASVSRLHSSRRLFEMFKKNDIKSTVIHHFTTDTDNSNELALQLGTNIGALLNDGNGDGILVEQIGNNAFSVDYLRKTSFSLLQGSRMRNTKTEFVSCPSCGRTLFDLQETTARIQNATGHLPGVTVAIMGCIVNGPGEMADADFGYVGTLPGKVDLYYGKEIVKKSIPNDDAVDALIDLIKEYDMWKDKETEEEEEPALVS